jgi:hypothetical protein
MKKYFTFFFCFAVSILFSYSQTLEIGDKTYQVDTLKNHSVGPGTHFTSLRLTGPARLDVFFLKVNLTNPYLTIKAAISQDSIYGMETPTRLAQRKSVPGEIYLAGTNGDFYDMGNGYPTSGNMIDSEIAKVPNSSRNVFVIDENKIPELGIATYKGTVTFGTSSLPITSVNHTRGENALVLYNRLNGTFTHTNPYGTEVGVELLPGSTWGANRTLHAQVVDIEKNKGNHAIPTGKAVLSGHGTAAVGLDQLSVGDLIDIDLDLAVNVNDRSAWTQMSGGDNYKLMLKDGVIETESVWNDLHPRTAIGYSQARDTLLLCVVDGRGESVGVTTKELAYLMKSTGAYTALNMDGGGSSCMYIEPYGGPVNALVGGYERPVANHIFVVSAAPVDPVITEITPYRSNIRLPRNGEHIPQFYGYNPYGVLLNMDLQDVALSCPAEVGHVEGNKFIASGTQSGDITATYNQTVIAKIHVDYLSIDKLDIRPDSIIIDNRIDHPIVVMATTGGSTSALSAATLSWQVADPDVCIVDNGSLKALQNGTTWVYGTVESLTDSLFVTVENPSSSRIPMEDFSSLEGWTISKSSQISDIVFNHEHLPDHWQQQGAAVNFTYQSGLVPFIRLTNRTLYTYGLPDTLKMIINTGDARFDRAQVFIRAYNGTATVSKNFQPIPQNTDVEWNIPLNELLDTSDPNIYPVRFDNMNLYLGSMTPGQAYTLALKEITQIYKGLPTGLPPISTPTLSLFPNPAKGRDLHIQLKNASDRTLLVEIYTLAGQKLQSENVEVNGNLAHFIRKNLPEGVYLLKVSRNGQSETLKLIIGQEE